MTRDTDTMHDQQLEHLENLLDWQNLNICMPKLSGGVHLRKYIIPNEKKN